MVYKNKGGQPRERTMIAAYSLARDFGAKQADIAKTLGCSQSTIANWIKECDHQKQLNGLQQELLEAKDYIQELNTEMNNNHLTQDENNHTDENYVPDYGYENDEDNFEHALDDVLKANEG